MSKAKLDTQLLESLLFSKGFKTRKAFAEAVNTSEQTISSIFNGRHKPSFELMNRMYRVLDLTPDQGTAIFFNDDLHKTQEKEVAR